MKKYLVGNLPLNVLVWYLLIVLLEKAANSYTLFTFFNQLLILEVPNMFPTNCHFSARVTYLLTLRKTFPVVIYPHTSFFFFLPLLHHFGELIPYETFQKKKKKTCRTWVLLAVATWAGPDTAVLSWGTVFWLCPLSSCCWSDDGQSLPHMLCEERLMDLGKRCRCLLLSEGQLQKQCSQTVWPSQTV